MALCLDFGRMSPLALLPMGLQGIAATLAGRCLSGKANDWESSEPWVSKVCDALTPASG